MGSLYRYKCPECGYTAEVCGGYEHGFWSYVTTITCEQCQEIFDLRISKELWNQNFPNGLLTNPDISCPKDPTHDVLTWDGPCPRCDGTLEDIGLIMDWS